MARSLFSRLPWRARRNPATYGLLALIIIAFLVQQVVGNDRVASAMLWPLGEGFAPWQLLSYSLLHGGLLHLAFNGLGLWSFGKELEDLWGPRRLVVFWLVCVVGAALLQLLVAATGLQAAGPTVGASGGVCGLLVAYALTYPSRELMLLIPPMPVKAKTLVIGFAAFSLVMGVFSIMGGIAHFAHLGGMLFGWLGFHAIQRARRRPTHFLRAPRL